MPLPAHSQMEGPWWELQSSARPCALPSQLRNLSFIFKLLEKLPLRQMKASETEVWTLTT